MTDIVAELRRLYEAAIQNAGDLDETASLLALNIAVVHHLPALLDAIDTLRWYADKDNYDDNGICGTKGRLAPGDYFWWEDYGERARAALAALEQDGEG
ncbi:MAG TPA: hypothetical protein PK593_00035 [Thermomicrobiales bacterium]|nr:hypothetical protein [Thermomicrobiales bacterium]HQZ90486.1 hypothetical protein [Thermomicrobiales bacterium]HRA32544.1 hypothetical protein [Thermomicrobiales bacterium]